jgi:hypothetical protein
MSSKSIAAPQLGLSACHRRLSGAQASGRVGKREEPARWSICAGAVRPAKACPPVRRSRVFFCHGHRISNLYLPPGGRGRGGHGRPFSPIMCPSGITLPASDVGRTWSMEGEEGISRRLSVRGPHVVRGQMGGHGHGVS